RGGPSTVGETPRGGSPPGCAERAAPVAAVATRFATGIPCSKSTPPAMYGRSDSAGAATQARAAAIRPSTNAIDALLRMLLREHITLPWVSVRRRPFPGLHGRIQD